MISLRFRTSKTIVEFHISKDQAGVEGLKKQMLKLNHTIGFCLYPVEKEDLIKIVDSGGTMPPKSTWFEPRLKNGLIVRET